MRRVKFDGADLSIGPKEASVSGYDRMGYLGFLRGVPMFSACSDAELEQIADRGFVRTFQDGTPLVAEGEQGNEFFVISSGKASVQRGSKEVGTLQSGDFFGELALFDPAPRNASVLASGLVAAVVLARENFLSQLDDSPTIRDSLLRGMARRLHELDSKV
jgi:CRP-like cAMP-binding protein